MLKIRNNLIQGLIRSSTFYSMIDASANFNKGDAQKKTAHIYSSAIGQKLNKANRKRNN